jgi:hypothetical protein
VTADDFARWRPYTASLQRGPAVRRLFTFGFGQTDPRTGESLSNCYVWVEADDIEAARHVMVERFGHRYPDGKALGNWAFDYPDEDAAGVARYGLHEIPLEMEDR